MSHSKNPNNPSSGKVFYNRPIGESPHIPTGIKMDESGRLVDSKGNVIELSENKSLKINKKNERKRKARPLMQLHRKAQIEKIKLKQSEYFDPELEVDKGNRRLRRKIHGLRFNEQGAHVRKAENLRRQEIVKQLGSEQAEDGQEEVKEQVLSDRDRVLRKIGQMKALDIIPEVEWWDKPFVREGHKGFKEDLKGRSGLEIQDFRVAEDEFNVKKITHYVQHPVPLKNPEMEKIKNMSIPIQLTEKERKRISKLRRAEKVKDRHEKISLGLLPPPEPRLKMSSFMRAVTAQAVADPSTVEKEVRRQEAERQKAHLEHNENRKLTKQQRAEKFKSKMERDAKKETWSALFKVKSLKDAKNCFKVDKNAQQLHLKGILINTEKLRKEGGGNFPNLVVVEGGKIAVKRYKKLLMRRIKWEGDKKKQESDSDSDQNEEIEETKGELKSTEHCALVWEGTLYKRFFDKWRHIEIKSEHEAVRALQDKGCEHYWTHVINHKLD